MSAQRVPRWLSEGISVFEERRARPGWGRESHEEFLRAYAAGRTLPVLDGLLLATAQVHRLTLVSRNVTDAIEHGVPVFSPYSDSA